MTTANDTMKYVYGIVWRGSPVSTKLLGVNDRPVHEIGYRNIALIVSEALSMAIHPEEESVLRHSDVVEECFRRSCILPLRFGTVLEGDEKVRQVLRDQYYRFRGQLRFVKDKAEFGVRFQCGGPPGVSRLPSTREIPGWHDLSSRDRSPGSQYLMERCFEASLSRRDRNRVERAFLICDWELSQVSEARKIQYVTVPRGTVDAAYLVRNSRRREFQQRVRRFAPGARILLTGPWPPYSFVEEAHA